MEKYTLKIKLLSDTIFSGGESIVSISDIDELYDEYKIPYYKGKSIKGNVRESAELIIENQRAFDKEKAKQNEEIVKTLFGKKFYSIQGIKEQRYTEDEEEQYRDNQTQGILKFENASLEEDVKENLIYMVDRGDITKEEIINSLTDIRYATKIDKKSGTAETGSLRSMRVLNRDITFYANIYSERNLTDDELGLLICAIKTTRHLGTLRSRGKGHVECSLISENRNLNDKKINKLIEKVVG
ncbi:RAMP superfamily CRISPR-associated protein [Intestinibacter sp.]